MLPLYLAPVGTPLDLPIFQIDAFTCQGDQIFSGNPAAVIPLNQWLDPHIMQSIAAENNLSETTFFVRQDDDKYALRWFTPTSEVDLCGHATLAAAHVMHQILNDERDVLPMTCGVGDIAVTVKSAEASPTYQLDFPARPPELVSGKRLINRLSKALGKNIVALYQARDLIAVLDDDDAVLSCEPDQSLLASIDCFAVAITAASKDDNLDFVSRFFAPQQGIAEDPVTGSSFCSLAPLWAEKLNKTTLKAKQCSQRGGEVSLALNGDIVHIAGSTFHYMQGVIRIPD